MSCVNIKYSEPVPSFLSMPKTSPPPTSSKLFYDCDAYFEEFKSDVRYKVKRDRSLISSASSGYVYDADLEDNTQLQSQVLADLEGLSLQKRARFDLSCDDKPIRDRNNISINSEYDLDDEEHSNSPSRKKSLPDIFTSHKRHYSKADQLFEAIVRKSRKLCESRFYGGNSDLYLDGLDDIPSTVGPSPTTDMKIATYWPNDMPLSIIDGSPAIGLSKFQRRTNSSIYDEDDEDSIDRKVDYHSCQPRMSGDNTHIGIIEDLSDISDGASTYNDDIFHSSSHQRDKAVSPDICDMDIDQSSVVAVIGHVDDDSNSCTSSASSDVIDVLTVC